MNVIYETAMYVIQSQKYMKNIYLRQKDYYVYTCDI